MAKFEFCRICLVDNVRMLEVFDSHLQRVFRKLTDIPFVTEDRRPKLVCYLCYARLKQCSRFTMKCLEAEEKLAQMLDKNNKEISLTIKNNEFLSDFVKTPIEHFNVYFFVSPRMSANEKIDSHETYCINVKEEDDSDDEFINKHQRDGDADMTNKINETDFNMKEKEHVHDNADVEDLLHCSTDGDADITNKINEIDFDMKEEEHVLDNADAEGDSTDGDADITNKINEIDFEMKEEEHILDNADVEGDSTGSPAAKKPKLDVQKESQAVAISTKTKINGLRNTEVRCKSRANKCVPTTIKPILSNSMRSQVKDKLDGENVTINTDIRNDLVTKNDDIKRDNLCHSNVTIKKLHQCYVCQKKFSTKGRLKIHIRTHTGEKPYNCNVCQRGFNTKSDLKRHTRIHTGEKPYMCDICQRNFNDRSDLKKHIRIHADEYPYKCDVCQRTFNERGNLNRHSRTHTGEKPFKCNVCQKSFGGKNNLKLHSRVHTGEKPYMCDICPLRFRYESNLKKHMFVHTGENPYKCEVCQRSFNRKSALRLHMNIHIGEPYTVPD